MRKVTWKRHLPNWRRAPGKTHQNRRSVPFDVGLYDEIDANVEGNAKQRQPPQPLKISIKVFHNTFRPK